MNLKMLQYLQTEERKTAAPKALKLKLLIKKESWLSDFLWDPLILKLPEDSS